MTVTPVHASTVTGTPEERDPAVCSPAEDSRSLAGSIITALTLPPLAAADDMPSPPLLTRLQQLRDASMLYDMGRVDASGRVACADITDAMGWGPGQKLQAILTKRAIVLRPADDGRLRLASKPGIIIPARARRPYSINVGDQVLIAAAPDHGIVIVHPPTALDEMVSSFHRSGK